MRKAYLIILCLFLFFTFTGQTICPPGDSSTLCNPTQGFASDLPDLAINIIKVIGFIIGWTVIAYVMFAGFRMVMSQGNEEEIAKAKTTFKWSLAGFLLALFAYVIVYAVSDFIGVDHQPGEVVVSEEGLNPLGSDTFGDLIQSMLRNFLTVAGLLAILLIVISGFRYITARGNEEQVSQAQKGLQWSIIGLIVILLSYVIVVATARFFGAEVTANP